jgi:Flp pilus assembly protein TadB
MGRRDRDWQWLKDGLVSAGGIAPFLFLILLMAGLGVLVEAPIFTLVTVVGVTAVLVWRRRRRRREG